MRNKKRLFDVIDMEFRGESSKQFVVLLWVTYLLAKLSVPLICLHKRHQIRYTSAIDRRCIQIWGVRDSRERRVTPVALSHNRDMLRIGDSLVDRPLHAISHIILHRPAPPLKSRFQKFTAVSKRSAKVHLQNGVSTIGEKLYLLILPIKPPNVAKPRS